MGWGGTKIYEDISEDELEEEIVTAVSEDDEDSYPTLEWSFYQTSWAKQEQLNPKMSLK